MADQTVVWTALPNGATGGAASRRLRLSVLVSPRLVSPESQPTLAEFADFVLWPQRLAAGQVAFFVQGRPAADQPPGQPVLATVVSPPPDPDLWRAIFAPSTPVESHTTDQVSPLVSTYSMAAVHDQLKQGHQALAVNSPVELPTLATLSAGVPASAGFTPMDGEPVLATLAPAPGTAAAALQQTISRVASNMFRADNATDMSQRVYAAIAHARQLVRDSAVSGPAEVMPRVMQDDGTADPASDLARVVAFTRGPSVLLPDSAPTLAAGSPAPVDPGAPAGPPPPTAPPPPSVFDFHRYLTFLAGHPTLLRRLGLVIDLEVPAGSLPVSPSTAASPHLVQVLPAFTAPLEGDSVSPYTAYLLEGQGESFFSAAPEAGTPGGPEILHGLLNLTLPGQYELIQVDVQGGALKLINTLAAPAARPSPQPAAGGAGEPAGSLPALRTSGISIARDGLALQYAGRVTAALKNDSTLQDAVASHGQPPVLFAEDLAFGYRFDVFDVAAQRWHSLHQRTGTYTFRQHPGGQVTMPADDEGAVQVASTQSAGNPSLAPDPAAEHYLHESLLHWQGWSLSVPRPGKTIADEGPATITSTAPPGVPQVEVSYQVQSGSLPRLRFGRKYRFRARTVDLAGNGPDPDETTALIDQVFPALGLKLPVLPATGDFTYCRFEPVAAPVLVPRARLTDGETADRLVIRSRTGVGTAQEAADLTAAVSAARPGSAVHYQPTCERHLVPPKTSQHMAETHGLLDASFGTAAGFTATYAIARKEKGRLTDTAVIDTATGQPVPLQDPAAVQVVATNPGTGEGYVVHGEAQLILPYLPDPMARIAALYGLPGVPSHAPAGVLDQGRLVFGSSSLPDDALAQLSGSTVHIPFTDSDGTSQWPDALPFRLVVAERTAATGETPTWDAQARVLTVFLSPAAQYSVRLSSSISMDDLNKLGQWQWLLEASPGAVPADVAQQGGRWQLTPGRTLTLVHAVEQPLLAPDVTAMASARDLATTFCYLAGRVTVHGESTGKIDLLASWEDAADPPGAPPVSAQAHVFDIPVSLPSDGAEPPADPEVVAVAAYDAAAHELTIQGPPPGDESGRTYLARHEFGDTRHRTVRYSAVATSRFGDCFPAEVAGDSARMSLTGAAAQVNVPSSRPPSAVDLVSVVPAFTWSRVVDPDGSRVSTRAGGVRVYLRRPWYSSGTGERLAVVLADPTTYPPDPELAPYVTHWGRDPIWPQAEALSPPAPTAFPGGTTAPPDPQPLIPQEAPGETAVALGYEVAHDTARDLLWCDIAIDPGPDSYFPMVRLALARYQPDSIPGCELSPVVLADFVQVPPQRTVRVSPDPAPDTFQVSVQGFTPVHSPFIALVRASVEQRIPGVDDADLGWAPVPDDTPGVTVNRTAVNQPPILWSGQITLPAGRPPGQFRIVIREVEPLPTDDLQGAPNADGRLVFAETVVL
jgi:hypothetical protein